LIELEATEVPARAACRKYLPEASSEVVRTFREYLDTVISLCRSTADPRLEAFGELKRRPVKGAPLCVQGASLEGGGRGTHHHSRQCKGRDSKGAPETVVRAILPQGPHASASASEPNQMSVGGMGFPPWGFLTWRGRLGWRVPRGETKAGEARHVLCLDQGRGRGERLALSRRSQQAA
jgi:hypothetical protein